MTSDTGVVSAINGPIVQVKGFQGASMRDMCLIGELRIPGEVIRLGTWSGCSLATIQAFENTDGLRPGDEATCLHHPLAMELGPGLIGRIFDGIQRPLQALHEHGGSFIKPGLSFPPLDRNRRWPFTPVARPGDMLAGGDVIGTVAETPSVPHKILVPPKVTGKVKWIAGPGEYTIDEPSCTLARTKGDEIHLSFFHEWPVSVPRPVKSRLLPRIPLISGIRLVDCLFPITKGGCAAIPGGFGTGKTVTQHQFAKFCDAQVIVYIGCGERGNEMADVLDQFPALVDPTGHPLMDRTILVGNTSNMPVSAREASIFSGMTMAEYYRDQGYHVALMADSTSRWAEALREISGRLEELPAEGGYPAYLGKKLASFYERAGHVELAGSSHAEGSISIIGAVSPPSGDFSDPVVLTTQRFIKTFWALDPKLAYARQYPAINWIDSYSLYADEVVVWWQDKVDPAWGTYRERAKELLHKDHELQDIIRLLGAESLPLDMQLVAFSANLIKKAFLQQNAFDPVDQYCSPSKQTKMLRILIDFHDKAMELLRKGAPLFAMQEIEALARVKTAARTVNENDLATLDEIQASLAQELESIARRLEPT